MESVGVHPIGVCTRRRQVTILERVACRSIYEMCTEADRIPGMIWLVQWWDQDTVN